MRPEIKVFSQKPKSKEFITSRLLKEILPDDKLVMQKKQRAQKLINM